MIKPEDIFSNYEEVNNEIIGLVKENNSEQLNSLMKGFAEYLTTNKPKYEEKELNNITEFFTSVPPEVTMTFIDEIDKHKKDSEEFHYVGIIHAKLMSGYEKYRNLITDVLVPLSSKK